MDKEKDISLVGNSSITKDESSLKIEGIDRILIPTTNLPSSLNYFAQLFGLRPHRQGAATKDPFLDSFAIIETPNGMVLELVTPKQEYINLFKSPIYCYTVKNLLSKKELLIVNGCTIIGDLIDTKQGWGWFYTLNQECIISQLQGQLPVTQSQ